MKWRLLCVLLSLLTAALIVPAHAVSTEDMLRQQEAALKIDDLERSAREAGGEAMYGESLDEGLANLIKSASEDFGSIISRCVRSGVLLMATLLLCGFGEAFYETVGKGVLPLIPLVGTLTITAIAVSDVDSMLGLGRNTIDSLTSFTNVLMPTVAAVTAATGAVAGASVRQMAAVLFSDLLVNLIHGILIPLLYGYLAVSVAYSALGNEGLKRIGALIKWAVTTILTAIMIAFVGYLSISGVVAGSADAMSIKATKFAISGTIPVVGGILSDAAETILASAGVLRGTVGVFGAVTILSLCLVPLLRIAVHYLMYKLVSAVSATVGSGRIGTLVDQIGSAFGLLLGMTGACCLLMLVALVASVTVVST